MKRLIILAAICFMVMTSSAQPLRVMSYNIRYDNPADGPNAWSNRKEFLAEQITTTNPDILGIQESLPSQVDWLATALKGYGKAGIGRDENGTGESVTVFFRMEKFEMTESRTFWLSETPNEMSKGWDAAIRRICTYVRLRDRKTGQILLVLNTHFDHVGPLSRRNSAELLCKKISELNNDKHPVILLGDFNATQDSSPIEVLKNDLVEARLAAANVNRPQQGSYNGFDTSKPAENLIDHIFVSQEIKVERYAMLVETRNNRYPSDHFPVVAELVLSSRKR
jgi:endonuclease/exonuclease/phosphatase family metal-dependent hydrolase